MRELLLRIAAILSRRNTEPEPAVDAQIGNLRLNLAGYRVYVGEAEVGLTDLEARLLGVLADHRDRVVTRDALLVDVWGPESGVTTAAVDSHVKRLRTKLQSAGKLIQTVRGVGYTLSTADRRPTR